MQFRTIVLALLAATPGVVGLSATATSERRAAAWLREHSDAPNADELDELRSANPTAYAIVKALLTKRSLGLLDPKHPSASFSAAKAPTEAVPGPEAFANIAAESGEKPQVQPMYPEAPTSTGHHNWMNWKPQQSAIDDEAMVNNVLGAVASLKGGQVAKSQEAPHFETLAEPPAPRLEATAAPVAAKPPASMNQENSYLKAFDLGSSAKKTEKVDTSKDYLTSFSWSDDTPKAKDAAPQPVQQAAAPAQKKNALLDWLSPRAEAVQRKASPTAAPAQENPYLSVLS